MKAALQAIRQPAVTDTATQEDATDCCFSTSPAPTTLGKVEEGTTVTDYEDSIARTLTAIAPFDHRETKNFFLRHAGLWRL
jgi:hypothetical protein